MTKTALITGITGQDGSYLAELLRSKGYRVIGMSKSGHKANHLLHIDKIDYVKGDLNNADSLKAIVRETEPDEVYNLASQSYPGNSWHLGIETAMANGIGAHALFEAVRQFKPQCKIYQASSSEMYGHATATPQDEQTIFNPLNPYAASKLYAHHIAGIYRKTYNMFISCGILFNHESPRRGLHFITQKVSYAAACLKLGMLNSPHLNEKGDPIIKNGKLSLGNLEAKRDWGYAGDYVEAMWLMLQQPIPDDFVIGTGQIKTIKQLCETTFSYVGLDWQNYVVVDDRLIRPIETGPTVANPSKAKNVLGWQAKKSFEDMMAELVESHLKNLRLSA